MFLPTAVPKAWAGVGGVLLLPEGMGELRMGGNKAGEAEAQFLEP